MKTYESLGIINNKEEEYSDEYSIALKIQSILESVSSSSRFLNNLNIQELINEIIKGFFLLGGDNLHDANIKYEEKFNSFNNGKTIRLSEEGLNINNYNQFLEELFYIVKEYDFLDKLDISKFSNIEIIKLDKNIDKDKYFFKGIIKSQFLFEQLAGKIIVAENTSHFTNDFKIARRYSKGRNIDNKKTGLVLYINKEKLFKKGLLIFNYENNMFESVDKKALKSSEDLVLVDRRIHENLILNGEVKEDIYNFGEIIPIDCIDFIQEIKKSF